MIKKELIILNSEINDKNEALEFMMSQAKDLDVLNDVTLFKEDVDKREEILPTSIGFKVAVPHGRSKGVKSPFVVFMKTKTPFIWDERNQEEVDFIFLIAIPEENENNLHLRFLAEISKKLMKDQFREQLRNSANVQEAYDLLNEINERI